MIVETARVAVQAFGALIVILSLWGIVAPGTVVGLVRTVATKSAGLGVAVSVRVLLGAALLMAAPASGLPTVFTVLGWIAILAAIGLVIMGRNRMSTVVDRVARWSPAATRIWFVPGFAFGAFLIYGTW